MSGVSGIGGRVGGRRDGQLDDRFWGLGKLGRP